VLATLLGVSACGASGLVKYYEYDEDIYLSIDGSATIYLNASVPALVALRGMDLDVSRRRTWTGEGPAPVHDRGDPRDARQPLAAVRTQFLQIRMTVDDVTTLGSAAPFSWATYSWSAVTASWCTASS